MISLVLLSALCGYSVFPPPVVTTNLALKIRTLDPQYMATQPCVSPLTAQRVSHAVITSAMKVHTELGPGLLESTYTACLQYELSQANFSSLTQLGLPVVYRGVKLELGYRIDLLVENQVIVEIKSVEASPLSIRPNSFRTSNSVANPLGCL
jgi:GxxExxY protein